jgi:hypothetical protein
MRQAARVLSVLAMAVIAGTSAASLASAQQDQSCRLIRADGAAYVERCGDKLNSFALLLDDISRATGSDSHGRFGFVCPLELMCEGKPEIFGWFIDHRQWLKGAQDEWAVAELLTSRPWAPLQSVPKSSCEMFEVTVGDMRGRAVCYALPDLHLSVILLVVADDKTGFALVYQQRDIEWTELRDKVMQTLPRFRIQRASGDAALMRWMR